MDAENKWHVARSGPRHDWVKKSDRDYRYKPPLISHREEIHSKRIWPIKF